MKNGPLALLFHALFMAFLVAPMLVVCVVAFTPEGYLALPTHGVSLRWFRRLVEYPEFLSAFRTSLLIAAASSVTAVVFATPAALAIARHRFPGRDALSALFLAPLMIPHVVLGIAFLRFFSSVGLSGTLLGLIVSHVVVIFPFALRMVLAGANGMDRRIEDAALSLGASRATVVRRVMLPLILPGIASGFALSFIQSFDEVTMTVFIASPSTTTLPVMMFNYIQDSIDPLICAVSTLMIVLTVLFMIVVHKFYGLERLFVGETRA
ncbi:ABC transporter permease [Methylobacterium mesophilicum]|uniref:ABC transporter permease n=1 Tax=Methylobacterium mesophilicum TaxID=39956 RepID=UPI002F318038